jgi:UDP-glucose 4-epimerase
VLIREADKPTLPIPHVLAPQLSSVLWRFGLAPFQGTEFGHLRFVCMVDGSRARRELGFRATRSIKEAVRAAVEPLGV